MLLSSRLIRRNHPPQFPLTQNSLHFADHREPAFEFPDRLDPAPAGQGAHCGVGAASRTGSRYAKPNDLEI